jgi:hypothetical protein
MSEHNYEPNCFDELDEEIYDIDVEELIDEELYEDDDDDSGKC